MITFPYMYKCATSSDQTTASKKHKQFLGYQTIVDRTVDKMTDDKIFIKIILLNRQLTIIP